MGALFWNRDLTLAVDRMREIEGGGPRQIAADASTYKMWHYSAERDPRPTIIEGQQALLGHLTGYVAPAGISPESLPLQGCYRICCVESQDGLHWEKPEIGLFEFEGSKSNNIISDDFKLVYVFLDPHSRPVRRKIAMCAAKLFAFQFS